jgi:transcriptional regulator with XRE-family HTH domain
MESSQTLKGRSEKGPPDTSFGGTLSELRWILRLTQVVMAENIGVCGSALSQYEKNKRVPLEPTFVKLTAYAESVSAVKPLSLQKRAMEKLTLLRRLYRPRRAGPRQRASGTGGKLGPQVRYPLGTLAPDVDEMA